MVEKVITIIAAACMKFHDSGETSCTAEARTVIQALEENNYIISKIDSGPVSIEEAIDRALERAYCMSIEVIRSKIRKGEIREPRQVGMFFNVIVKDKTQLSLAKIGKMYGDYDHATVLHAYNKILGLLPQNNELDLRSKVEEIAAETGIDYKRFL
jgi:chromosomal replication initiation ATPase DnaA